MRKKCSKYLQFKVDGLNVSVYLRLDVSRPLVDRGLILGPPGPEAAHLDLLRLGQVGGGGRLGLLVALLPGREVEPRAVAPEGDKTGAA